jgi:hypothetical protein
MQRMGLCAVYQRPRTTIPVADHEVYSYLLRDLSIDQPNRSGADVALTAQMPSQLTGPVVRRPQLQFVDQSQAETASAALSS